MPTLDQVDPSILYSMFKGEPGTRKSSQALSYPLPHFWFSWDRKMSGILIPARKWKIDTTQIDYEDYENWDAPRKKLEQLQVNCKYKTLIFDSITTAADSALRQTMKMKVGVTRSSGASAGKVIAGIPVNEIEDYMAEASALQELISLSKDIHRYHKVNVILVAHVIQAEYKSATGQTHFSRTIVTAGKRIAPKIPAYCGEAYHFNIKKGFSADQSGQYALLTEHTGDDFARTALPLDREIIFGDDPLYPKYILPAINKLKGELNELKPPPTQPQQPPQFKKQE